MSSFISLQAEFATSAVDFLHRVGRTARAGQPGLVTSLYNESNRDLVATVRLAEKRGQPVVSSSTFGLFQVLNPSILSCPSIEI